MEATLTFGSIGDIIAVCQLAVQLGKVLGVGAASSAGIYEALRKDLDTFVQVLMHVRGNLRMHYHECDRAVLNSF